MSSSSGSKKSNRSPSTMVTQMYTFNTWSKPKPGGGLPYVGFPGLSLTPIQESPLLMDSILNEDNDRHERMRWLHGDRDRDREHLVHEHETWDPHDMEQGSLPKHWITNGSATKEVLESKPNGTCNGNVGGGGKGPPSSSSSKSPPLPSSSSTPKASCCVNVHVVRTTTFLPKDEPMTAEQKRAHICKLLLFALCGFVIVAGIVLWIFSPAFT